MTEVIVRKGLSSEQLNSLKELLNGSHSSSLPKGSSFTLTRLEFTTELFKNAPHPFVPQASIEELNTISTSAWDACLRYLSKESSPLIEISKFRDQIALTIVTDDRPFIVSSIFECARILEISINLFLHPIFSSKEKRLSLSYILIDADIPQQSVDAFSQSITKSLSDLVVMSNDFSEMIQQCKESSAQLKTYGKNLSEEADFLSWLADNSLIFSGIIEWPVNNNSISATPVCSRGIFRSKTPERENILGEIKTDIEKIVSLNKTLIVSKLTSKSTVHRHLHHIHFAVRVPGGDQDRILSIIGLLTSKALSEESSSVPFIRHKLNELLALEECRENSYDYKYIVDTIDHMPKDEVLRFDIQTLRERIYLGLGFESSSEIRVISHRSERDVSVLVVIPRSSFNVENQIKIQYKVEKLFNIPTDSSECILDVGISPQAKIYFYFPLTKDNTASDISDTILTREITEIIQSWDQKIQQSLKKSPNGMLFKNAFPSDYRASRTQKEALLDISRIQTLTGENPLLICADTSEGELFKLCIYRKDEPLRLSKTIPVLENAGLDIVSSEKHGVNLTNGEIYYIHTLISSTQSGTKPEISEEYLSGLTSILSGKAENDRLNSLLLSASLSIHAIKVIRSYALLLFQVNRFASRTTIFEALSGAPKPVSLIWKLFDLKFNPSLNLSKESRTQKIEELLESIKDSLRNIKDVTVDRIIRSILSLMTNTVRTNAFSYQEVLAFKLHSEKIDILPSPKPLYEIYVHSNRFEGTHLRTAMVARGGIRWSDRLDDFRSEVLGLMKTQRIKNVLIVPSGAKGGFAIKNLPSNPKEIAEVVASCYEQFVNACLSITDNIVEGSIVSPKNLVIYDELDPYFVMAADKGTATFSDRANKIATEKFAFWLGDAFASGGSNGYDHKLYGITAKGAWECVKRHFRDLGIDYENSPFTAVGIGDMAGDVFGNGLILSRKVKLLAAFNHKHIFVDPNPDPEISFKERERLFNTPGSQWTDYSPHLISTGGGVFDKFSKEIFLTAEMKVALGISNVKHSAISGEELISAILRAPCDLLWNGGIGTYVKAKEESHADVNDGTNDRVRINADELRCKVVGEGGNLGFTQLARIQFASKGGAINTDAIDNSGGVDLSDHEVNIKILLNELVKNGSLLLPDRNKLLLDMSTEVVKDVLSHNQAHATVITIGTQRSKKNLSYIQALIRSLVKQGYLDRTLDSLPEDEELQSRMSRGLGLTRPEYAVCLAGTKMWLKQHVLQSNLIKEKLLQPLLISYFPKVIREKYETQILNHQLADNIIATQITNSLIDSIGLTFIFRLANNNSVAPEVVVKCLLAAKIIIDADFIERSIEKIDTFENREIVLLVRKELGRALRRSASWLLRTHGLDMPMEEMVVMYHKPFSTLVSHAEDTFFGEGLTEYNDKYQKGIALGMDVFSIHRLSVFSEIELILEMLLANHQSHEDIPTVARVYTAALFELGLPNILKMEPSVRANNKWEHQILHNAYEEIKRRVALITTKLIKRRAITPESIKLVLHTSTSIDSLFMTIEELNQSTEKAAGLSVLAKQLKVVESTL